MTLLKVLKVPSSRTEHKLIGASLPARIHAYLTLYSLAKGTTKSRVIKELLDGWITVQREKEPDRVLIEEVIARINLQWKIEKDTNPNHDYTKFRMGLTEELSDRGINEKYISLIMSQIKRSDGKD